MARKVDHEQRKREIAEKAIRLFSQVGYDNVSLIMIAAAAGVSRTALYQYFCSKREVLDAAIVRVTDDITARCTPVLTGKDTAVKKLEGVCHAVLDVMFERKEFLVAVFDFVIGMVRTGADMNANIRNFTTATRTVLQRLVEIGKQRGELPEILQVKRTTDVLYSGFESAALRIVIGTETDAHAAKVRFSDMLKAISTWR